MQVIKHDNLWFQIRRHDVDKIKVSAGKLYCLKGMYSTRWTGQYPATLSAKKVTTGSSPLTEDNGRHYDIDESIITLSNGSNKIYLVVPYTGINQTEYLSITDGTGGIPDDYDGDYITALIVRYLPQPESASFVTENVYLTSSINEEKILIGEIDYDEDTDRMDIIKNRVGIITLASRTRLVSASP